jgi:anti-sigma factor RsiW
MNFINTINDAEISAYIDDELDSVRMQEVEQELVNDPVLPAQYEDLKTADRRWKSVASSLESHPTIVLPRESLTKNSITAALLLLLAFLVLRFVPKFITLMSVGVIIHAIALAFILLWVIYNETEAGKGRWAKFI